MPHYLIAQSETPAERDTRRRSAGKSSGETFAATLHQLAPDATIDIVEPADEDAPVLSPADIELHDAVFLAGSPLHVYEETPATRRAVAFMRAVFASGTPSFGSCAGLQVATAAAGGRVRKMRNRMEAGISRGIVATAAGRDHPLLRGRATVWDAPTMHSDEVAELPEGGISLAGNATTMIQAAEIRFDRGIFWGVQYHPELSLGEITTALRRQAADLIEEGLADDERDVADYADRLSALYERPDSIAARWRLGVDAAFADEAQRRCELVNFLAAIPDLDRR